MPGPRLIDLHVDWPLQYAADSTVFDPSHYPNAPGRVSQAEGYLGTTRAAVVACYRCAADWASRPDPWKALGDLIARVEAEFSGRLLIGPDDWNRWRDEPDDALTWALVGVEGFDALVRDEAGLDRLPGLFNRGVRVFQPVYGPSGVLAGSSAEGDDRGISGLGGAFLERLAEIGSRSRGPRPVLDLAHLNPRSAGDVLGWFEAEPARTERLIPVYSHGAPVHDGFATPRAITAENLRRLRALGGYVGFSVGPPFFSSPESLKTAIEQAASLPRGGREGYEGIAIGTDFLGVDRTLPGLSNAGEVVDWVVANFDEEAAPTLLWKVGAELIGKTVAGLSNGGR